MFNIIFYKPQDDSRGLNDIKKKKHKCSIGGH